MKRFFVSGVLAVVGCSMAFGQDAFVKHWESRVNEIQALQPGWPVPVVGAYPGLVQLFRTDIVRERDVDGVSTWNYGNAKGLDVIPWRNTEIDINPSPYLQHNSVNSRDGFGDTSLSYKYRFLSANETHGSYVVSASISSSIPTGTYKNGSAAATLSPTIYAGKGFGRFDVQSSISMALPTEHTATIGRPIEFNNVFQYHLAKLWPELEINSTYAHGGQSAGNTQVFITPGLMVSKFKLDRDPSSRLAVLFGGGMQIAASRYHSYNHAGVLSARIVF
jgi:hypothetical protein